MNKFADLFSKIINGSNVKKNFIKIKKSNKLVDLVKIFNCNGLIKGYIVKNEEILVFLKYKNNIPILKNIKMISKPSKKIFLKQKGLFKLPNKFYIISTTSGFMTQIDAKNKNLGGELICSIFLN